VPQSGKYIGSKVLRVDTNGKAASGNKPPKGFDKRIYTYGHRNVQGIAFMPGSNTPVTAEHGPWHSDEITVLSNGGNGGWDPRPNMAGRGDCPANYCGYMPNQMEGMNPAERVKFMPMTDLKTYPNAMVPAWNNNGKSQGTSCATFLSGKEWGDWDGRLAVGIMGIGFGGTPMGMRIDIIDIADGGKSVNDVSTASLPMAAGRFRSVVQGPDGALYAAVDEGVIHRLSPK
jgi:glucose/arabinose dehydrogenase